jgi:hypothetical protein
MAWQVFDCTILQSLTLTNFLVHILKSHLHSCHLVQSSLAVPTSDPLTFTDETHGGDAVPPS